MNPTMKSHGKYRIEYVLLICSFPAGASTGLTMAQSPTPAQPDQIVGNWRWTVNRQPPGLTVFRADGTVTLTNQNGPKWKWIKVDGEWRALPSDTVERQYEILWTNSSNVDKLALSQDGALLYGENSFKDKISGKRMTDDATPTDGATSDSQ
jgi:hypothetical protein